MKVVNEIKNFSLPFAYSAYHLESLDRRIGRFQRLEPSHRSDQLLELAVIGLDDIIPIFDLPVHKLFWAPASAFNSEIAIP